MISLTEISSLFFLIIFANRIIADLKKINAKRRLDNVKKIVEDFREGLKFQSHFMCAVVSFSFRFFLQVGKVSYTG